MSTYSDTLWVKKNKMGVYHKNKKKFREKINHKIKKKLSKKVWDNKGQKKKKKKVNVSNDWIETVFKKNRRIIWTG